MGWLMHLRLHCVLYAILLMSPAIAAQIATLNYESGEISISNIKINADMDLPEIMNDLSEEQTAEAYMALGYINRCLRDEESAEINLGYGLSKNPNLYQTFKKIKEMKDLPTTSEKITIELIKITERSINKFSNKEINNIEKKRGS
jgi:hypothetical protein